MRCEIISQAYGTTLTLFASLSRVSEMPRDPGLAYSCLKNGADALL